MRLSYPGAISPGEAAARRSGRDAEVAGGFAAVLLREAFAPLARAMGFYGDLVTEAASEPFARAIERTIREGVR